MTSNIIYYDFTRTKSGANSKVTNSPSFAKSIKFIKATRSLNTAFNNACLFLCGISVGISILVLLNLVGIL